MYLVYNILSLIKTFPVLCRTDRDALHYQDKGLPFHLKLIV
jgi:hypothetical protein